jgi:hypothetical protein
MANNLNGVFRGNPMAIGEIINEGIARVTGENPLGGYEAFTTLPHPLQVNFLGDPAGHALLV